MKYGRWKREARRLEREYKLKDVVIPATLFGAKGDGIADDTEALQHCLDYLAIGAGGTVTVRHTHRVMSLHGMSPQEEK